MMHPQQAKLGLQFAAWIVAVALLLLPFLERDSAEFVITGISLIAGLLFGTVVFVIARRSTR